MRVTHNLVSKKTFVIDAQLSSVLAVMLSVFSHLLGNPDVS